MPTTPFDSRIWIVVFSTPRGITSWDYDDEGEAWAKARESSAASGSALDAGYLYTAVLDPQGNCKIEQWQADLDAEIAADIEEDRRLNSDYYASR